MSDVDVKRLQSLIDALETGGPGDEQQNQDALDREIRNHAYLL